MAAATLLSFARFTTDLFAVSLCRETIRWSLDLASGSRVLPELLLSRRRRPSLPARVRLRVREEDRGLVVRWTEASFIIYYVSHSTAAQALVSERGFIGFLSRLRVSGSEERISFTLELILRTRGAVREKYAIKTRESRCLQRRCSLDRVPRSPSAAECEGHSQGNV